MAGVGGTDARNPMRQTFGCCARAASGHVATVPPTRVMNARRRMCPQIEGLNLPYRRGAETALCNTAKLGGWGPSRVTLGHSAVTVQCPVCPKADMAERRATPHSVPHG